MYWRLVLYSVPNNGFFPISSNTFSPFFLNAVHYDISASIFFIRYFWDSRLIYHVCSLLIKQQNNSFTRPLRSWEGIHFLPSSSDFFFSLQYDFSFDNTCLSVNRDIFSWSSPNFAKRAQRSPLVANCNCMNQESMTRFVSRGVNYAFGYLCSWLYLLPRAKLNQTANFRFDLSKFRTCLHSVVYCHFSVCAI